MPGSALFGNKELHFCCGVAQKGTELLHDSVNRFRTVQVRLRVKLQIVERPFLNYAVQEYLYGLLPPEGFPPVRNFNALIVQCVSGLQKDAPGGAGAFDMGWASFPRQWYRGSSLS